MHDLQPATTLGAVVTHHPRPSHPKPAAIVARSPHIAAAAEAELTARCRKRPLAVLLDEAHTLDLEVGRTLLNTSQQVRDEAPFLLVLAGTPGLPAHLGSMNAPSGAASARAAWASAC